MFTSKRRSSRLLVTVAVVGLLLAAGPLGIARVASAHLTQRTLQISDQKPSATAIYKVGFSNLSAATLGAIKIQFCANDPLPGQPCDAPVGFSATAVAISAQTGETGFAVDGSSTVNMVILSRQPAQASSSAASYSLSGVINPAAVGTYFVRLQTYASQDASGSALDYGGLAFQINQALSVQAEVPPYLLFCTGNAITAYDCASATGNEVNFGELSSRATRTGASQLLAATNAAFGYNVRVLGSSLTSGNNVIPPLISNDYSRIGVSQFGLNLRVDTVPQTGRDPEGPGNGSAAAGYDTADSFRFVPGEVLASAGTVDDYRKYTVSYLVNVSRDQPAGVYVSTLTYVCLANF